jgi:hypothetical protein
VEGRKIWGRSRFNSQKPRASERGGRLCRDETIGWLVSISERLLVRRLLLAPRFELTGVPPRKVSITSGARQCALPARGGPLAYGCGFDDLVVVTERRPLIAPLTCSGRRSWFDSTGLSRTRIGMRRAPPLESKTPS